MKTFTKLLVLTFLIVALIAPAGLSSAQTPPDVINQYTVTVTPRSDGTLDMRYDFDYCATTDFPSGSAYLDVGVPNRQFELVEYGPTDWVTSGNAKTSGGSWVHVEFADLPRAGDCFTFFFSIHQSAMAHPSGEDMTFQFIPGWFDFAQITKLTIIWVLPTDATLVKTLDPEPVRQENGQAIWEAQNLAPNEQYEVNVAVSQAAFPDFVAETAAPAAEPSDAAVTISLGTLCLIVVIAVLVLLVLYWLYKQLGGSGYDDGGYVGGYHGGGTYTGGYYGESPRRTSPSPSLGRSHTSPSRRSSGGGAGGSTGRSSSCACACVSCACACACAGAGRAGCDQKGFDIRRFLKPLFGHEGSKPSE